MTRIAQFFKAIRLLKGDNPVFPVDPDGTVQRFFLSFHHNQLLPVGI